MNNYLLRVPNSINSKTNTEVKIVQRWNGVKPDVRFVYSYFLAYLVDKKNQPHYSGPLVITIGLNAARPKSLDK